MEAGEKEGKEGEGMEKEGWLQTHCVTLYSPGNSQSVPHTT